MLSLLWIGNTYFILLKEHSGVGVVDADGDVGQHIEFTTEDGQKLRFVASSDVNQLQLVADLMSSHMSQVCFCFKYLKLIDDVWWSYCDKPH